LRVITCHFPDKVVETLDLLVETKIFPNRSEAIRFAVRDFLKEENQKEAIKQVKAYCNLMKNRSIDPDYILHLFKEWLSNG